MTPTPRTSEDGLPGTGGPAPARDPGHSAGRRHRLLRAVGYAVAFTLPVAALGLAVRSKVPAVLDLDETAISAATDVTRANPDLRQALLVWQTAFQATGVNAVCTAIFVWAWRRHGLRTRAQWAFVTLMASWAIGLGVKHLVQRARPVVEDAVAQAPGFSFPSGHATNTAAAGMTLILLLWPVLGRRGRLVLLGLVVLTVLVTGVDRVFLGVHYPSDVVAGIVLGAAMAGSSYLGYLGWNPVAPSETDETKD
jgi:undecaprenyl-diphosphatase